MSLHRTAAKRDQNESVYVELFEKAGITVERLSEKGKPDLLLGKRNHHIIFCEVKTAKSYNEAARKQTEDQRKFRNKWSAIINIELVWSIESCLALVKRYF
jgi:hypothetical protein